MRRSFLELVNIYSSIFARVIICSCEPYDISHWDESHAAHRKVQIIAPERRKCFCSWRMAIMQIAWKFTAFQDIVSEGKM